MVESYIGRSWPCYKPLLLSVIFASPIYKQGNNVPYVYPHPQSPLNEDRGEVGAILTLTPGGGPPQNNQDFFQKNIHRWSKTKILNRPLNTDFYRISLPKAKANMANKQILQRCFSQGDSTPSPSRSWSRLTPPGSMIQHKLYR